MIWITDIVSKIFRPRHGINYNSGKTSEEIYKDLGVFQYFADGFLISYEDFSRLIKWNEITQLNAYKKDLITIDRIEIEIVCDDKRFTISEDLPGWFQFIIKTKEIFPTIPKDWDTNIIQPPFATNFTIIYDKTKNEKTIVF